MVGHDQRRAGRAAGRWAPAGVLACAALAGGCGEGGSGVGDAAPLRVVAVFGEVGRAPGQFSYPRAIDAGAGSLWVIDKAARVQRLDPGSGRCLAWWQMPEWSFGKPTGVTVGPGADGAERLYVADTHYHRVMIYRPPDEPGGEPTLEASFGSYGTGPGQFIYPTDVAVLPAGDGRGVERIFVSEYGGNDRVSAFDGAHRFLFSIGRLGFAEDPGRVEFSRPQSLAIEPTMRELIVADACNHRLGRFTLDGALVGWIGSPGSAGAGTGQFRYPYGLLLPGDGTALVVEYGNNRVQHVELSTGRSLGVFGRTGRGEGELASPWGIAAIGETAYVLDSGNNRVQAFRLPGRRALAGRGGGG